jgi:Carbohydrate-selective porin, OprB family/S-layer homology domain
LVPFLCRQDILNPNDRCFISPVLDSPNPSFMLSLFLSAPLFALKPVALKPADLSSTPVIARSAPDAVIQNNTIVHQQTVHQHTVHQHTHQPVDQSSVAIAPVTQPPLSPETEPPALPMVLSASAPNLDPLGLNDAELDEIDQVTSVSQFTDVRPTDWAFQALQSLVERYGCIVGYPNKTFRGDRALTRYEFAAGLNACLDKVQELLAAATADFVKKDDLESVKKLQENFAAELAVLKGRTDALEVRTATLEKQQFSTTAILRGQVVFGLAAGTGGNPPGQGEANAVLTDLVQLQLTSSFTGRDLLRIGFASANFGDEGFAGERAFNTNMALLSYQGDVAKSFEVSSLDYRFALGDRLVLTVQPVGFSLYSVLSPNSSYLDAGTGAVSRFAALNPVFRIGNLDAGVGFDWLFSDRWRLQGAYGVRTANDPAQGLFGSGHQAFGLQLLHKPNTNVTLGLAYVNAYSKDGRLDTFTGSSNADLSGAFNEPAKIHALAGSFRWRLSPKITLGFWGGVILTDATFGKVFKAITDRDIDLEDFGAVTLSTTYLFSLGIQDPFRRKGDLLVFAVGQPPKLQAGVLIERVDDGNSFHLESFYRFRISDQISIDPGFFYVTNPGHIQRNNNIFIGTVRATFNF